MEEDQSKTKLKVYKDALTDIESLSRHQGWFIGDVARPVTFQSRRLLENLEIEETFQLIMPEYLKSEVSWLAHAPEMEI